MRNWIAPSLLFFTLAAGGVSACNERRNGWEELAVFKDRPDNTRWAEERRRMVDEQLRGRDIDDPAVLAAMALVAREQFVPSEVRSLAYQDGPLPIGSGQTISQPYIVAIMSQLLHLKAGDKILEIGTGSGYQAAVLAQMEARVYSIEILPELSRQAEKNLLAVGEKRVKLRVGDGYLGWPEEAPFQGIVLTAAPPRVPAPLIEQLAEGGRLVLPLGRLDQELVVIEKRGGQVRRQEVFPVRFVPMTGRIQKEE